MVKTKIGLVDLDTSHPGNWVPIIRALGYEVVGVYDSGTVHPQGYDQNFAEKHAIGKVYSSLEEMADEVDIAIIHSCNWDEHTARALPFVKNRKAIMIDKPIAGNIRDVYQLLEWESQGIRITGGSSLRVCQEVKQWVSDHPFSEDTVYAYAGCGVDEFNYGIHAYSLLHGLFGPGIISVRHLGTHLQQQIEIVWADGRRGVVGIGQTKKYIPFYATITTETDVSHFQVDNTYLYKSLLETSLPYLSGNQSEPIALSSLLEVEMSAIAARLSKERGGRSVLLSDIPLNDPGYNGQTFAKAYRRMVLKI